jgi:hypothetical protein
LPFYLQRPITEILPDGVILSKFLLWLTANRHREAVNHSPKPRGEWWWAEKFGLGK